MNGLCLQKIKIGHRAKSKAKKKMFFADFISGGCNFTQQITFSVLVSIHSADAYMCRLHLHAAKNTLQPP